MTFGIMQPLPATINGTSPGTGAANLLTPDPREAFQGSAFGEQLVITLDLGTEVTWDTVFVGYATAGEGWAMSISPGGYASTFAHSYRRGAPLRHALIVTPAPVVSRYIQVFVPGGGGIGVGVVAAGLSIRPKGYENGSGRPISDTSRVERLFGGGLGIDRGVASGGWSWTMPLTDEERDRLYALALDAGIGSTVLVTEQIEPGMPGANEAMHWGTLTKLEPWNRQAPGETVWSMQVQDW